MSNFKALFPFLCLVVVLVILIWAGDAVSTERDARVKNVLIGQYPMQAYNVQEKDGCLKGVRKDTGQSFTWCGDYLIVEEAE